MLRLNLADFSAPEQNVKKPVFNCRALTADKARLHGLDLRKENCWPSQKSNTDT
jgi:hypothetical protein